MKIRILFSLLCLLVVISGCQKSDPEPILCDNFPVGATDVVDNDDSAIFDLVLETYYGLRNLRVYQQAGSQTRDAWVYGWLEPSPWTVDSAIVENCVARNVQPIRLPDSFYAPVMPLEEFSCLTDANPDSNGFTDFWENYYIKYPDSGGYIDFELPGYDNGRNVAILRYTLMTDGLSSPYAAVLEKVNGLWTILHWNATS